MNISAEITSLIDEIKNNKVDGASELARQAVKVLKIAAERSQVDSVEQVLPVLPVATHPRHDRQPFPPKIFPL